MINKICSQGLTLAKKKPEVARQTPYLSFADRNIESYAAGMCFFRHHVLWVFTHFSQVCGCACMCVIHHVYLATNQNDNKQLFLPWPPVSHQTTLVLTLRARDECPAWQPLEIERNETRSLLLCSITHRLSFVCFGFSHLTVQSSSSHFCGGKVQGKVQFPVTSK